MSEHMSEHIKWFILFMLNPQEQHGLNNAFLRALLSKHPAAADCENHAHIHINNLAWAMPITASNNSATTSPPAKDIPHRYPQAYASPYCDSDRESDSESGIPLVASNEHIYIETEKHIICLINDWLISTTEQDCEQELQESINSIIQIQAQAQDKQALLFHINSSSNSNSPAKARSPEILCQLGNEELLSGLRKILQESRGAINMPDNNDSNQFLPLLDLLLQKQFSLTDDESKQPRELRELYKQYASTNELQDIYATAGTHIQHLQQLRDHQSSILASNKSISAHCWLWYPLKFANRQLADGLPYVVYELEQESFGKITLDLHLHLHLHHHVNKSDSENNSGENNYWRMDVFRRPGRPGIDIKQLLQECGIDYYTIDKHKNYVAKYIVLKLEEPDNLHRDNLYKNNQLADATLSTLYSQVDSIIAKLTNHKPN